MSPEIQKYLQDILSSIESIDIHLNGKRDLNYFLSNLTVRRAVERELEIIGEATSRILKLAPELNISHARLIVDTRNKVIHAYDSVDEYIVWKIIVKDIPILKQEVSALLTD